MMRHSRPDIWWGHSSPFGRTHGFGFCCGLERNRPAVAALRLLLMVVVILFAPPASHAGGPALPCGNTRQGLVTDPIWSHGQLRNGTDSLISDGSQTSASFVGVLISGRIQSMQKSDATTARAFFDTGNAFGLRAWFEKIGYSACAASATMMREGAALRADDRTWSVETATSIRKGSAA